MQKKHNNIVLCNYFWKSSRVPEALDRSGISIKFNLLPAYAQIKLFGGINQKIGNCQNIEFDSFFWNGVSSLRLDDWSSLDNTTMPRKMLLLSMLWSSIDYCDINNIYMLFERSHMWREPISTKQRYVHKGLLFWTDFLIRNCIDSVFFGVIPNSVSDFLLLLSARYLGRHCYALSWSPITSCMSFLYDAYLDCCTDSIYNTADSWRFSGNVWLNKYMPSQPRFKDSIDKSYQIQNNIATRLALNAANQYEMTGKFVAPQTFTDPNWHMYSSRNEIDIDVKLVLREGYTEYFVFFLHVEPESTTCPLGGVFVDQLAYIGLLRASLPVECMIVIKEHPYYDLPIAGLVSSEIGIQPLDRYRGEEFNKFISCEPGLCYLEASSSITPKTLASDKHCIGIGTFGGSVIVEALLEGLPVVAIGKHPFVRAKNVITSISDQLYQLMKDIKSQLRDLNSEMRKAELVNAWQHAMPLRGYFEEHELAELTEVDHRGIDTSIYSGVEFIAKNLCREMDSQSSSFINLTPR